jgi:large repetitive protein
MLQSGHRASHRPRPLATILIGTLLPLGALVPVTIATAGSALASPSPGYTATLIPTGQDANWVAVDPDTGMVYFADVTDEVTVIDSSTNAVVTTIAMPGATQGVAVDAVTDTVYVTVAASTTTSAPVVAVIDGATNTVTATIALPVGSTPDGVAVDSSTGTVYVAEDGALAVAAIDESTNSVMATVSMNGTCSPDALAVDESTDVIWAGCDSDGVVAISGASDTVTPDFFAGSVGAVAVDPATDTVYATIPAIDELKIIDGATGTVSMTMDFTLQIWGVAFDTGTGTLFASSPLGESGTTLAIDASSDTITDTIERGGAEIAVNTATGSAYAAPYIAQTNAVWALTPSATNAMSPVIKSTAGTFAESTSGSFTIAGTALPAATYSETGSLPSGVTLSSAGVLSGTPAAGTGGVYPITITASNGIPPDYSQAFTLTVDEPPAITSADQATFTAGTAGTFAATATSIPGSIFTESGVLPTGVTFSPAGVLSGTPAAGTGGVYPITVTASNGVGTPATQAFTLTVDEAPAITSADEAAFVTGAAGSFTVTASGFPAPSFTESGPLPAGVTLSSGGVLSGTPAAGTGGSYPITVTASNGVGTPATQSFTLTVTVPPAAAVGAEGGDGALWVQAPQLGGGWQSLGGQIAAAPAVAAIPNANGTTPESPLFIATAPNHELWLRSLTAGWQELGPVGGLCLGPPAAVVTGTAAPYTLTVACEGTNRALWETTTTWSGTGLPSFTAGWASLGGVLSAGPAVAAVGGTLTFFVLGTNGVIYTSTGTGFSETSWDCIGAPAAATQAATGVTTFACQGGDHALWTATNDGSGWTGASSLGGQLTGGPGIAATSQQVEFYAEGTNGAVWENVSGGWSSLGGTVTGGTGATALN